MSRGKKSPDMYNPPRTIDSLVDDVTRAVVDNGGRPLPYFVVSYGTWLKARGQLAADREALGLPFLAAELPVQNFLIAMTPIVFQRPSGGANGQARNG